jgi:hypothetical protein
LIIPLINRPPANPRASASHRVLGCRAYFTLGICSANRAARPRRPGPIEILRPRGINHKTVFAIVAEQKCAARSRQLTADHESCAIRRRRARRHDNDAPAIFLKRLRKQARRTLTARQEACRCSLPDRRQSPSPSPRSITSRPSTSAASHSRMAKASLAVRWKGSLPLAPRTAKVRPSAATTTSGNGARERL